MANLVPCHGLQQDVVFREDMATKRGQQRKDRWWDIRRTCWGGDSHMKCSELCKIPIYETAGQKPNALEDVPDGPVTSTVHLGQVDRDLR